MSYGAGGGLIWTLNPGEGSYHVIWSRGTAHMDPKPWRGLIWSRGTLSLSTGLGATLSRPIEQSAQEKRKPSEP